MHFEHDGMSLWYGLFDTPAPSGAVHAGSDITVTIAVKPADASNKVNLLYRIGQNPVGTVAAKWLRHDLSKEVQYFKARFPALRVGDTVDYTVVCRCAGRQVPLATEAQQLMSSFHVVRAEAEPTDGHVKEEHVFNAADTCDSDTSTSESAGVASQQKFVSDEPASIPIPPASGGTRESHTENPSEGAALPPPSSFLHLDTSTIHKSVLEHYYADADNRAFIKVVLNAALKNTLARIFSDNGYTNLAELIGNIDMTIDVVASKDMSLRAFATSSLQEKVPSEVVPQHIVSEAFEKLPDKITLGDVLDLNVPIKDHPLFKPALQQAFPMVYLAEEVAKQLEIDTHLVKNVLAQNPHIHPGNVLPTEFHMIDLNEADQARAKASIEALHQESTIFPKFDYKTALEQPVFHNPLREGVAQFLHNAPDFDLCHTHVDAFLAEQRVTALKGIAPQYHEALAHQLKRMQRVFRVIPDAAAMNTLLVAGLDSAHAITRMPQSTFVGHFQEKLGSEQLARETYAKAEQIHALATTAFAHVYQLLNDISPRVIGSVDPAAVDALQQIPDWPALFGPLEMCDCEECHSVYGAASYFVDLLQFLDMKSPPVVDGQTIVTRNPLDVLCERRPDLQYIDLTCENTGTTLPYIDLVNEILETYVATYVPKSSNPSSSPCPPNPTNITIDGPTLVKNTLPDDTSEELSISPAYINNTAYDALKDKCVVYPLTLPYNHPLEIIRAYLQQAGSSRYEVMKTFQRKCGDPIILRPSDVEIACEYLAISPEEHAIFINTSLNPAMYGYPASMDVKTLPTTLAAVPELLKQMSIHYMDLLELLHAHFLNPTRAIQRQFADGKKDPCDLNNVTLQNLDDNSFLAKLPRFIRLWQKIGWSIRDLDRVLYTLKATEIDDPTLEKLALIKQLQAELNIPLVQLISLWGNIDADWDASLYSKLFQNRTLLNPNDNEFSNFKPILYQGRWELTIAATASPGPDATISAHISTIRAALQISATDLDVIRTVTGLTDDPGDPKATPPKPPTLAPLNMSSLSMLYRFTVLARALRNIIRGFTLEDLASLKILTRMDPFVLGEPVSTRQFLDVAKKVGQSGFSVAQLNYIYRHLYDGTSGIAPIQQNTDLMMTGLHGGLQKIADDTAVMSDPTGDLLRRKLSTILDEAQVPVAMALIDGSAIYTTSLMKNPQVTFPEELKDKIAYDGTNHKLLYHGNMTDKDQNSLNGLSQDLDYQNAVNDLHQQPKDIIENILIFLPSNDAEAHLLNNTPLTDQKNSPTVTEKYTYVLRSLMASLRLTLSKNLIKQALSEALKLDVAMTEFLLESALHAESARIQETGPAPSDYAMAKFLALSEGGISATYFAGDKLDPIASVATRIDPTINFTWSAASPPPSIGGSMFSVRWAGRVKAPESGLYTFMTYTNDGVRLWVDNQLLIDEWHDQSAFTYYAMITLRAGQLYDIKMEYYSTSTNAVAQLQWSSPSTDVEIIPQDLLYPGITFATFLLLHKVALLINTLKITVQELAYISNRQHNADFSQFDLNALPTERTDDTDRRSVFNQWEMLYDLFTFRDSLPQGETSLIDVFSVASASQDGSKLNDTMVNKLIAATGWNTRELALLTREGTGFANKDADFKNVYPLSILQACLSLGKRLGVSVGSLLTWSISEPDPEQAQAIKDNIKAMYDTEQWLAIAKPINDRLRESQRSALVAYLLQVPDIKALNITSSKQLYEYFLIDVDMNSCLLTSRIVQANASIQLFVQRCLMNLEAGTSPDKGISPAAININQWQWMKRYRTWEANRKVFLYPENWLEPELRDNKSPFFEELETELLQSDMTLDTAEQAFLNYLEKLDQVARLEICGMYWQEEDQVLHVFGRSFSAPRVYYYRQFTNNMTWTPWEKVDLDIEGDHLIPVIYNRRLYLFWPIFTQKSFLKQNIPTQDDPPENKKAQVYWEIKIAWSEYKQNKWQAKQVSSDTEVLIGIDTSQCNRKTPCIPPLTELVDKSHFIFKAIVNAGVLSIHTYVYYADDITVQLYGSFEFAGYRNKVNIVYPDSVGIKTAINYIQSQPLGISFTADPDTYFRVHFDSRYSYMMMVERNYASSLQLWASKPGDPPDSKEFQGKIEIVPLARTPILGNDPQRHDQYYLMYPHQYYQFAVQAPFFYQDSHRTYFVWVEPNQSYTQITNSSIIDSLPLHHIIRNTIQKSNLPSLHHADITTSIANTDIDPNLSSPTAQDASVKRKRPLQLIANESEVIATKSPVVFVTGKDGLIHPFSEASSPVCLRFTTYFHPHIGTFLQKLNQEGIPGVLALSTQNLTNDKKGKEEYSSIFEHYYRPDSTLVDMPYPKENVDFCPDGAYSLYNWELFFHAPMLIATRLSKNQRFAEAQQWFHYIFNPTDSTPASPDSPMKRFWKLVPFQTTPIQTLEEFLRALNFPGINSAVPGCPPQSLAGLVAQWRENPFDPHLIARIRLISYMKNVVMKYIDNLIAWGDQLFQQDTMESINEATQLYILAAEILGPRPEQVPLPGTIEPQTYHSLAQDPNRNPPSILDSFSNAIVSIENVVLPDSTQPAPASDRSSAPPASSTLGSTFYFCIPQNDNLLGYWDTVADRLFKIRHCMNIEGVVHQLPLFAPPIDVSLLVQAAAAGIDISSVLNDINAATPHYHFTYMLQKALELCADLKALGGALLAALEKKDAEGLVLLRSTQETALLSAVEEVKKQQIEEAKQARTGLDKTKLLVEARRNFYRDIVRISDKEQFYMDGLSKAHLYNEIAQGISVAVSAAHLIPNFDLGIAGWGSTPTVKAKFGGGNLGSALQAAVGVLSMIAAQYTHDATMASITGGYDRRWDDWKQQENLASKELDQIQEQITGADIRVAIAERELQNHRIQVNNSKEAYAFMCDKYTNQELYDWMISQLSAIFFQCYQIVYDLAKRTEKAFRFERGLTSSNYITFGYWDSLKKGLLSGERLYLDLKRLEMAYIDQNKREYEITKQISLVLHDPMALIALKETGACAVNLPETLFDMDYPGHYMRRIKSVALTIPCVTGPYTSINCTLTLLSNQIRIDSNAQQPYQKKEGEDDPRFISTFGAIESIATSTAQSDSGMFEVNFRDERYLPFEGAGVISTWRIDMPKDCNAFDFETISDVILKISYMARDGGGLLQEQALKARNLVLKDVNIPQARLFSAKHEFPGEWYRFLHPVDTATSQMLPLALVMERFPFLFRGKTLEMHALKLFLKLRDGFAYNDGKPLTLTCKEAKDGTTFSATLKATGSPDSSLPYAELLQGKSGNLGVWTIEVQGASLSTLDPSLRRTVTVDGQSFVHLNPDAIEDIWIVCQYTV